MPHPAPSPPHSHLFLIAIPIFISIFITFSLITAFPASAQELPNQPAGATGYAAIKQNFETLAAQLDWGGGQASFAAGDANLPIPVVNIDADRPLQPGNALQLATAAAALDLLGQNYKFPTELRISGDVTKGTLNGPVIVSGSGDPTISQRYVANRGNAWDTFDTWATALKAHGIRRISGGVIADARRFDAEPIPPGWPDDLLGMPALPSIGALNFNHNCVEIDWISGNHPGTLAAYEIFPTIPKFTYFTSTVRIGGAGTTAARRYARVTGGNLITASGELAPGTAPREFAAIEEPGRYFAEAFRLRLQKAGLTVFGEATSTAKTELAATSLTQTLDVHFSPPLKDIIQFMLWHDSALEAEVLLKTIGATSAGGTAPGSFTNGAAALAAWLDNLHTPTAQRQLVDGSGRSDLDRIAAGEIVAALRGVMRTDVGPTFRTLLPHAGEGLLVNRLQAQRGPLVSKKHWWSSTPKQTILPGAPIWAVASEATGQPDPTDAASTATAQRTQNRAALAGFARTADGHDLAFALLVTGSTRPPAALRGQLEQLALTLTH